MQGKSGETWMSPHVVTSRPAARDMTCTPRLGVHGRAFTQSRTLYTLPSHSLVLPTTTHQQTHEQHRTIPRQHSSWLSYSHAAHTVRSLPPTLPLDHQLTATFQTSAPPSQATRTSQSNARTAATSLVKSSRTGEPHHHLPTHPTTPFHTSETHCALRLHSSHREWFTFCFVPLIPFSLKPWNAVHCNVCNFQQDIKYRPDVEQQMQSGGVGAVGGGGGGGQGIPMQNQPQIGNQGWNRPAPPPGGVPQYK